MTFIALPPFEPLQSEIAGALDCDSPLLFTAKASGGTPPYQYLWSTGDTTSTVNFAGGAISLTVTDAEGCTFESGNLVISQPSPLLIDASVTDASAPGASDGSIVLDLSGGEAPFNYNWSNGATSKNLANIPAGEYTVTITQSNGCTSTATFQVNITVNTEETSVFQQLLLSPNPTEGLAVLSIKLHKPAAVRVTVHDATGRLALEKPETTASELAWPLDLLDSPSGIYSVFIFVENEVFVRKMAMVK